MTGCSLDIRERSSEALDAAEAEIRATAEAYHDRYDRISVTYICERMSYADLIGIAGSVEDAATLYNRLCADKGVE